MERIILDVDPGIDDALALILALKTPELKVEGITTVSGNVHVNKSAKNALKIINLCQRQDVYVYKGLEKPLKREYVDASEVHGKDGLGNNKLPDSSLKCQNENAVDFIIKTIKENPYEITIAALAPLTNIASAILKDKETMKKVKNIVIMGGTALHPGNRTPSAEYNFFADPDAAKIVFESGAPITMVGLDATHDVLLTPNLREFINQIKNPISNFIVDITGVYMDFYWQNTKVLGCTLHDPLIVAYLINPNILELRNAFVEISTEGITCGESVTDFNGEFKNGKCNAKVAMNSNKKEFFQLYLNTIFPNFSEDIDIAIKQSIN